jgi:hypothetical protein
VGINVYDVGDLARISALFEDADGTDADPSAVAFHIEDPSGNVEDYAYGASPTEIVRDSIGNYHIDISIDEPGDWHYRWVATGSGQGAQEGQLMVRPRQVA